MSDYSWENRRGETIRQMGVWKSTLYVVGGKGCLESTIAKPNNFQPNVHHVDSAKTHVVQTEVNWNGYRR